MAPPRASAMRVAPPLCFHRLEQRAPQLWRIEAERTALCLALREGFPFLMIPSFLYHDRRSKVGNLGHWQNHATQIPAKAATQQSPAQRGMSGLYRLQKVKSRTLFDYTVDLATWLALCHDKQSLSWLILPS